MKLSKSKILLALTCSLITAGCFNKMKHKVGMVTSGPNEYTITRNKPLEVPPHFNLEAIEREKNINQQISHSTPKALLKVNKKDTHNLNSAELELLQTAQQ